jgi:uncharacterized membrane protein HdeD (DUF308 family)
MDLTKPKSSWLTIEAVVLILLGVAALILPLFAGVALTLTLGVILILVGAVGLVSAFAGRDHAHLGWSVFSGALALIAGLVMLFTPLAGAVILSVLFAIYLLLDGVSLIGIALDHRKHQTRAWGWLLAAGIADILIALFIVSLTAFGSAVFLGVILGIDLILAGAALLLVHGVTRRAAIA